MMITSLKVTLSSKQGYTLPYALLLLSLMVLLCLSMTHALTREIDIYETKTSYYEFIVIRERTIIEAKQKILNGEIKRSQTEVIRHSHGTTVVNFRYYYFGDIDVILEFAYDEIYHKLTMKYLVSTGEFTIL